MRDSDTLKELQPLGEIGPLVRAALARLNGRYVLVTSTDGVPLVSGCLVVVEGLDGPVLPALTIEFKLREIVFVIEVPLGRVFPLVSSWNGERFVYELPTQRLTIGPV